MTHRNDVLGHIHGYGDQGPGDVRRLQRVNAVQLTQSGSFSAWSIREDGGLLCTDMMTFLEKARTYHARRVHFCSASLLPQNVPKLVCDTCWEPSQLRTPESCSQTSGLAINWSLILQCEACMTTVVKASSGRRMRFAYLTIY